MRWWKARRKRKEDQEKGDRIGTQEKREEEVEEMEKEEKHGEGNNTKVGK
jgi:hypothetical protein